MTGTVLITGADGYLGRRIAGRLLAETGDRLVLTVRADHTVELDAKRAALHAELGEGPRITVVPVDLRRDDAFAAVDPRGITAVVHTAARTEFTVERPVAQAVNVDGTARTADFAARCPGLERLLVLSTVFASGRRTGVIAEEPHGTAPGFVNHYEWSKNAAEAHLLDTCAHLPLTIARLTTVVADDDTGAVTQVNVFHRTLKLLFHGLLSLIPGDPGTPQTIATAEFSSAAVARLLRPGAPGGVFHVVPRETLPLRDLLDTAFGVFGTDPGFRRRRLLRPSYCDLESFRDLAEASRSLTVSPMAQAIGSVAPFAEQMFLAKTFGNGRLLEAWPDCPAVDPGRLVGATCEHLVRSRWGRRLEAAAAAGTQGREERP